MIAPRRARRPGAGAAAIEEATPAELEACPFCEGREDRTPPEVLAVGRSSDRPDTPGWRVRVVPNLYPAFERQEVVVHSPHHVRSFAELTDEEVALVGDAWRARAADHDEGYLHALINEGRAAGASLAHSHSQLVWMREPPPALRAERQDELRGLRGRGDLVVAEREGATAIVHPAGRTPYETLVDLDGDGARLTPALQLVAEIVRRIRALEGPAPWNAWLHRGPRPHFEIVPRLSVLPGVELGAGIYVNTLAPEEAAARLRAAS